MVRGRQSNLPPLCLWQRRMTPDRPETSSNTEARYDRRAALAGAVAGLGAAIAIGGMEWFSLAADYPLAVIPFAASIQLVIGSPGPGTAPPPAVIRVPPISSHGWLA